MIEPSVGALLIADPFLKDPNFMRSVVLICEHQSEGSFGFVINRPFENTLDQLMTTAEGLVLPVYYGGPVQTDTLHFLHQYQHLIDGGQAVGDGIFWGGDFETAVELLRSGKISEDRIRFFIGYSGWGEGQLESEMKEGSWLTVGATRNIVFEPSIVNIWPAALKEMGGKYEQLIHYPIDPQLN